MMKNFRQSLQLLKKTYHNNSGLSLVELLITLALLSIVLSMGFSFYIFGVRSFDSGERQSDVQQNARMAGDFITKELRIAERVIIFDEYDGNIENVSVEIIKDVFNEAITENYYIYFIYLKDGAIYYQTITDLNDLSQIEILQANIAGNINFDLEFTKSQVENNMIKFTLSAEDQETGRVYSFDTEVLVLNTSDIESEYTDTGKAVFFRVPDPPNPAIQTMRLGRYEHVYGTITDGEGDIDILPVTVYTVNVPADQEIGISFGKLEIDGSTTETSVTNVNAFIVDNIARTNLSGLDGLNFGNYVVQVKSPSPDEIFSSQRRFYYVHPTVHFVSLVSKPGNPHLGTVKLKTGGIPQEISVIRRLTAFVEEDYYEDLNIALVDGPAGSVYNYVNYVFHQTPTWSNDVDGYSNLSFGIKVDDPADVTGDIYLKVVIGKYEPLFLNLGDIVFESLKSLSITDYVLDPTSASDPYTYSVAIPADVTEVEVKAELQYNEGAKLIINGLDAVSGVAKSITLNTTAGEPAITVDIISEDGLHKLASHYIYLAE